MQACNIQNAFLQAPTTEKYFIICGQEFSLKNPGKASITRRAVHGGKAYGRDFRSHLRYSVEHLGITEFLADPDIWMRPAIKSNY